MASSSASRPVTAEFDADKTKRLHKTRTRSRSRTATSIRIRSRSRCRSGSPPSSWRAPHSRWCRSRSRRRTRNSKSSEPHIPHLPGYGLPAEVQVRHGTMDLFPDGRAKSGGEIPRWEPSRAAGSRPTSSSITASSARPRAEPTDNGATRGRPRFPTQYPDSPGTCAGILRGKPFAVDIEALVQRGQKRFNIYCTPCHGYDGHGQGMVHRHASRRCRTRPGVLGGTQPRRGAPTSRGHRRCRRPDAQRAALQHDLERLQQDDGLRGPDPRVGSMGDRLLRPCASQRAENASATMTSRH